MDVCGRVNLIKVVLGRIPKYSFDFLCVRSTSSSSFTYLFKVFALTLHILKLDLYYKKFHLSWMATMSYKTRKKVHFCKTMHCLPQRLKSTFFEKKSSQAFLVSCSTRKKKTLKILQFSSDF